MPTANMTATAGFDRPQIDRLLTTTRAVRKRLDLERPVEPEVIQECIRIAIQAPTEGGYAQQWRWLAVTDPVKRARLAELYRQTANPQRAPRPEDGPRTAQIAGARSRLWQAWAACWSQRRQAGQLSQCRARGARPAAHGGHEAERSMLAVASQGAAGPRKGHSPPALTPDMPRA